MGKKGVMLREISVQELHGPWSDFMKMLQTKESEVWFREFKRFRRGEPCWVDGTSISRPGTLMHEGTIEVDSSLTPKQALAAVKRAPRSVNQSVLRSMPRGVFGKIRLLFISFGKPIASDMIVNELSRHDLALANPFVVMAWNAKNPAFADMYPNTTLWQGKGNKYCYVTFIRSSDGERSVTVCSEPHGFSLGHAWWYGCVPYHRLDLPNQN